jgi:hypothetical protein
MPANADAKFQPVGVESISCPSAGDCSAVGNYADNSSSGEGLLLTETAGSWAAGTEAALPANANTHQDAYLISVSCATAGNCSAVGTYVDSSNNVEGLLLTETAGTWGIGVEAILPADAATTNQTVFINSVSCSSAGNCSAVGTYSDNSGTNTEGLLLTETAGSWATGVEAVLPAGAVTTDQEADLSSVSCGAAGNCSAVGSYEGSSGTGALLLNETGGSWASGVEADLPADAASGDVSTGLSSVSCASAGNCSAVGVYTKSSGSGEFGLLLSETAGNWSAGVKGALPANASVGGTEAPSVSCASAGNCTAVSTYFAGTDSEGLRWTETAGSWATGVEMPVPANANASPGVELSSVSCPSADDCSAVGSYVVGAEDQGLLLTETAGSWTASEVVAPANAASNPLALLESVSCPSTANCSGAGNYIEGSSDYPAFMLFGGSPTKVELHVAKSGAGAGTVKGDQAGLRCGSTCSVSLDSGTSLTLTATPSAGSRFQGWSGGNCSGTRTCLVDTGISRQTLTATFALLPRCVVPGLRGKTLTAARHAIRSHNCTIGKITHAASSAIRKGRVVSQKPKPGKRLQRRARVSVVVSRGRR